MKYIQQKKHTLNTSGVTLERPLMVTPIHFNSAFVCSLTVQFIHFTFKAGKNKSTTPSSLSGQNVLVLHSYTVATSFQMRI